MYPPDHAERLKHRAGQKWRPSNGTEGELFYENWCATCVRDAAHRADPTLADGCDILAATMAWGIGDEAYPEAWRYGSDGQPRCTAFTTSEDFYRCPETADLFGDHRKAITLDDLDRLSQELPR